MNSAHPDAIPHWPPLLIPAEATDSLSDSAYIADRARDIALCRRDGIDAACVNHKVDVLLAPMGAAGQCTGQAGTPVVTVPVTLDPAGVPFGISLFTSCGGDAGLLAVAALVEGLVGVRQMPDLSR